MAISSNTAYKKAVPYQYIRFTDLYEHFVDGANSRPLAANDSLSLSKFLAAANASLVINSSSVGTTYGNTSAANLTFNTSTQTTSSFLSWNNFTRVPTVTTYVANGGIRIGNFATAYSGKFPTGYRYIDYTTAYGGGGETYGNTSFYSTGTVCTANSGGMENHWLIPGYCYTPSFGGLYQLVFITSSSAAYGGSFANTFETSAYYVQTAGIYSATQSHIAPYTTIWTGGQVGRFLIYNQSYSNATFFASPPPYYSDVRYGSWSTSNPTIKSDAAANSSSGALMVGKLEADSSGSIAFYGSRNFSNIYSFLEYNTGHGTSSWTKVFSYTNGTIANTGGQAMIHAVCYSNYQATNKWMGLFSANGVSNANTTYPLVIRTANSIAQLGNTSLSFNPKWSANNADMFVLDWNHIMFGGPNNSPYHLSVIRAVGGNTMVIKSSDNGSTWSIANSGVNNLGYDIRPTYTNGTWLVFNKDAANSFITLASIDNGSSWSNAYNTNAKITAPVSGGTFSFTYAPWSYNQYYGVGVNVAPDAGNISQILFSPGKGELNSNP